MLQISRVNILGVEVDSLSVESLHDQIAKVAQDQRKEMILNVNVQCLNLAYENQWLQGLLNRAYLVFCDGAGVMLGARILGSRISQRITYADWIWQLGAFAERQELSLFFLGGKPGVAEKTSVVLKDRFPHLSIAGTHHGYFEKSQGHADNDRVIKLINNTKPNILIVGFGMPLQEKWLMEYGHRLDVNVMLTGGAVFDYVSGELLRAPRWMTENGLEWFGRLLIEPQRLWRRYLVGNPLFLWRVVKQRFQKSGN